MTFREFMLACPHCGTLARFHGMMSCFISSRGATTDTDYFWTDLGYESSEYGRSGGTLPITRCSDCHRYYRKEDAKKYDSFKVKEPFRSAAPLLVESLTAQDLYDAIAEGVYQGQQQEYELRHLAWHLATEPHRESVRARRFDERQLYYIAESLPIDLPDRIWTFRSLISRWLRVSEDPYVLQTGVIPEPSLADPPAFIMSSPDFENRLAEQIEQRRQACNRQWKRYAAEPQADMWWSLSNLEKTILLMPEDRKDYGHSLSGEKDDYTRLNRIRNHLLEAEALRQSERFDESLRLLGDQAQFKEAFLRYRHVARVIQDLASRGYRFVWLSTGEEDYSPAELAEQVRNKILERDENNRRWREEQAARQRDLEWVRKTMLYQADLDRRGCLAGKTLKQQIEEKLTCPNCQFRYLWNGERCGHCDTSVFEAGRPNSRALDKLRSELAGS